MTPDQRKPAYYRMDYNEGDEWLIPTMRGVAEKEKPEAFAKSVWTCSERLIPVPGRAGMYRT